MEDSILQMALEVAVQVLVPVLLTGFIALMTQAWRWMRTMIEAQQMTIVLDIIAQLVLAAEQIGLTNELLDAGYQRMAWVLARAEITLAEKGIHIDADRLRDLIEAVVFDQLTRDKPQPEPQPLFTRDGAG